MTDTTDTDTRTFAEWLRESVQDAEAIAEQTKHLDGLTGLETTARREGIAAAYTEILARYEQAQADEEDTIL